MRSAVLAENEEARTRLISEAQRESYSFAGGRLMKRIVYIIIVLQAIAPILLWGWGHWAGF